MACSGTDVVDPAGSESAALIIDIVLGSPSLARPDHAHVRVTAADNTVLYDDNIEIVVTAGTARVDVEVELSAESVQVDVLVELLEGERLVERGTFSVTLRRGQSTTRSVMVDDVTDDLAVGANHACYLDRARQAICWGTGPGTGLSTGGTSRPVVVPGGQRFVAIAAGGDHTCALADGGQPWCWGEGSDGQLGDGTTATRTTPAPVSGGHVLTRITAGLEYTCGLTAEGVALCWGANNLGQLGNATITSMAAEPVPVETTLRFTDLRASLGATCGIAGDEAWCWGFEFGGGTARRNIPTLVAGPADPIGAVAPGAAASCLLTRDGSAYCWGGGDNGIFNYGQLGNGSLVSSETPVAVTTTVRFNSIATPSANNIYAAHTCGIATDDVTWCWGMNRYSELGTASTGAPCRSRAGSIPTTTPLACSLTPVRVNSAERFSSIGLGQSATCALARDGQPHCWGRGVGGLLGRGDLSPGTTPAPVAAPSPPPSPNSIAFVLEGNSVSVGDTLRGYAVTMSHDGVPMPAPEPEITTSDDTIAMMRNLLDLPTTPPGGFGIVGVSSGTVTVSASVAGLQTVTATIVVN